jgi:transmembrane 9 superfamily protein 2/4
MTLNSLFLSLALVFGLITFSAGKNGIEKDTTHSHNTFYLPGVTPSTFQTRDNVKLSVSKLTSLKTQIPYDYYSMPYCKPSHLNYESENIGEQLSGDRNENSVYQLEMKVPKACEVACAVNLKRRSTKTFIDAIKNDYYVHWIVDNLPVGMLEDDEFIRGFPVGFQLGKNYYIYNHIRIIIL